MDELTLLLEDLSVEWRERRMPIADALAPGLTHAEIDALLGPVGIRLPQEARGWWGWRNGVPLAAGQVTRRMTTSHEYLSLQDALSTRAMLIKIVQEVGEQAPPGLMQPHWLPLTITMGQPIAVCDTSVPLGAPVPVYLLDWGGNEDSHLVPAAGSITDMVRAWLEAFRAGAYQYYPDEERWYTDFDILMSQFPGQRLV